MDALHLVTNQHKYRSIFFSLSISNRDRKTTYTTYVDLCHQMESTLYGLPSCPKLISSNMLKFVTNFANLKYNEKFSPCGHHFNASEDLCITKIAFDTQIFLVTESFLFCQVQWLFVR